MTSPITYDEAIRELRINPQDYGTPLQLQELVSRVDASSSGRVTVFYSGGVAGDLNSSQIVGMMLSAGEDIRVIDNSDAAKFLNSREFYQAVADVYGIPARPLIEGSYRGPATDWLYHPTRGPWAEASARFVDATMGDVRAIVSDAHPDRVFGATELPRLLANPNVTTIEGIPREALISRQASHGTNAAFEMIAARSYENVGAIRVATRPLGAVQHGVSGQPALDSRAYFAQTGVETHVPRPSVETQLLASRMNPPNASVLAGRSGLEALELSDPDRARVPRIGGAARALGIAGLALEAYDGAQTYRTASRLRGEGNDTAAESELIHFGSRSVGGLGGAAIGAGVGGAATSWSGPGMLVGGTVGGVIGVFGGERFAQWTDNRSIYNQQDRSGNTWTFDPDQPQSGWQRSAPVDEIHARYRTALMESEMVLENLLTRNSVDLALKASAVSLVFALAACQQAVSTTAVELASEKSVGQAPVPTQVARDVSVPRVENWKLSVSPGEGDTYRIHVADADGRQIQTIDGQEGERPYVASALLKLDDFTGDGLPDILARGLSAGASALMSERIYVYDARLGRFRDAAPFENDGEVTKAGNGCIAVQYRSPDNMNYAKDQYCWEADQWKLQHTTKD